MKNTVEKVIKRSIKICKNWKILTRNENFTAGQKMGANALLFFGNMTWINIFIHIHLIFTLRNEFHIRVIYRQLKHFRVLVCSDHFKTLICGAIEPQTDRGITGALQKVAMISHVVIEINHISIILPDWMKDFRNKKVTDP